MFYGHSRRFKGERVCECGNHTEVFHFVGQFGRAWKYVCSACAHARCGARNKRRIHAAEDHLRRHPVFSEADYVQMFEGMEARLGWA